MSRTKHKPKSVAQIHADAAARRLEARRNDFEAVGLNGDGVALLTNDNIDIVRAGEARTKTKHDAFTKKVDHDVVMRLDAFHNLRDSLCDGGYDAVRKFETLLTISRGEHDRGRNYDRVDNSKDGDRTDAMVKASREIAKIVALLGAGSAVLLTELLDPSVQTRLQITTWRDVVAKVAMETNLMAQSACVRMAVKDLVKAFEKIEARG